MHSLLLLKYYSVVKIDLSKLVTETMLCLSQDTFTFVFTPNFHIILPDYYYYCSGRHYRSLPFLPSSLLENFYKNHLNGHLSHWVISTTTPSPYVFVRTLNILKCYNHVDPFGKTLRKEEKFTYSKNTL